ncbi:alpha/beta-hydrolase [Apodospora peruviana]|uniref:Alpha/beta-hydrolase n=1 Tax=Apodospora peruviana TaxID=516989 RepID=A0AAE0I0L1_9PEZI|nr:alpha/beta-hydrolase [Apodospora peruviana]
MIDHLLGRPSVKSRRLQVLAVLGFWSAYLFKGHKHGPPVFRFFSRLLSKRLTAWQTVVMTMIYLYAARHFSTLVGLASPEPMANMYDTTYFRATWVLTALDAGFWTAMKIKYKWLRDLASIVFSVFYMVAAEKADEKVRKVRANITVEHLRVSWNKGNSSPYLRFLQGLVRPRFTRWPPRAIRIPRPATSDYKDPVSGWLYYDGPLSDLEHHNKLVLDIPGGGFVAMDPRCNDDKLNAWAAKTGLPILSLDYKKAPEYPYPYALNECYDVYTTIVKSRGRCIGMSGREVPKVVLTGDSAGGTLATSTTLMIVESSISSSSPRRSTPPLPIPDGLIVFYPALDMNIGSWMSDEQMALIKDRRMRGTNKRIIRRKTMQYNDLVGTPHQSDDEDDSRETISASKSSLESATESSPDNVGGSGGAAPEYAHSGPSTWSKTAKEQQVGDQSDQPPATTTVQKQQQRPRTTTITAPEKSTSHHPEPMRTRLAMSSMISYFNDRVLTPEMMRAMIILYVGPHNRPDFSRDYLLSPILAPDVLLARFPKTYFLTGERDPLVDDTVVFAGRLRRVKAAQMASGGKRFEYRDEDAQTEGFNEKDIAEVALIPGISHGFLQFPAIYPPAWGLIDRISAWIEDVFHDAAEQARRERDLREKIRRGKVTVNGDDRSGEQQRQQTGGDRVNDEEDKRRHHKRQESATSTDEDRPLEMMRMTRGRSSTLTKKDVIAAVEKKQQQQNGENGGGQHAEDLPEEQGGRGEEEDDEQDGEPYTNGTNGVNGTGENNSSSSSSTERQRGGKRGGLRRGRKKNGDKSLVKLASSDDLLGRRMHGLAGGLTGLPKDAE